MGLEPSVPAVIGHYSVEHVIGAGGMGVVYQARDTKLDRPVAIKAIADRHLLKPGALDRLRGEARAAAQLDHPYVCRVYELVETGTNVYIVMEYVEGETLRDRLRRGRLPYPDAIRLSTEIAEGLADAHARGLVHRDVKPANVIITPHGHVKILDFGLARRDVSSPADAVTEEKLHTSIGAGTPQYMAPEQAAGRPITARADVYAIGVVLFECLTGNRPFDDGAALNVALARVAPPEIVRLVARCLEPNPAARFENAGAVAAELRTLLPSSDSLAGAPPAKKPWWRRRRSLIEITAAAFVIAASIWIVNRPRVVATTFDLVHLDAEPSTEFDSRISPDGKLVSFISDRLGTGQLFVKEATGGNVIHVDTGVSDVLTHVWSPDGSECAVVVHLPGSYRGVLQVFRATFGGSPRLTIELDENLVAFRASRWVNNAVYLQAEDRTAPGNRAILLRVPLVDGAPAVSVSASWTLPGDLESLDVNPAGDKAVLALSVAGQEDLFAIGLDGSELVRLTDDAFFQRRPIWSGPNAVVFQSNQNGQSDLWEMDLRSKTSAPVLTGPEEETAESASADGSVITLKQFSVNADLWAIAEPGQPSRELTAGEIGSFAPSISANGRFLAVQRLQPSADRADPFADSVIEAGPLVAAGLLATTRVDAGALPMLSPDGSRIAYLQRTGGTTYRLLMRVLAGTKSEIVSTQPTLPSYAPNRLDWGSHPFSWSPDGRSLYFVENSAVRTFVVGTGPAPEPLAQVPSESLQDPVASSDGRSLAFLSQKAGVYRLHILTLASHEDAVVVLNEGHKSGMTFNRGWSRDGRSVVLIRDALSAGERTAVAEVITADRRASSVVASVPGGLVFTAFLDAFRSTLYLTQVQPAGHRVVAVSLPAGTLTELKQTSNPRVTFSGLATANGGPIVGVQDERRTGVWLARRVR